MTQTANPPSFEAVWAALQEVAKRQEETDRQIKEIAERLDRQMLETDSRMLETDKWLDKQHCKPGYSIDEVIERMAAHNLREKFRELGLNFTETSSGSKIADYDNNIFLVFDGKLQNTDKVMLIDVKTDLSTEDVQDHIQQLEKMRVYADLHGNKRSFLGSVAGVVVTTGVKLYALGKGLYVIKPAGETFTIIPPNGPPKEW